MEYSKGLSNEEVIKQRKKYGTNELKTVKKDSFFKILLETLGDPIIKILLIALGIKTVFLFKDFDWYETIGILIAIFLASFISTISEYGSEKAFNRLQEESSKIKVRVRRDNKTKEIDIDEVVVGDIILLATGDKIPADGILVKGEIVVDESSLTGEAKEIYKTKENNKLYRGSVVYSKNGLMQVSSVGDKTFYGRISSELQEKTPISPLKLRLTDLAKTISKIGYIGAFLGSISYLFSVIVIKNNFDFPSIINTLKDTPTIINYLLYALTLSVTIIIVAVPEGLPMMITLVLSSNMKRMLKNNVLVRKLVGIETSGSLNILFFDKTGTITKGHPEVIAFLDSKLNIYKDKKSLKNEKFFDLIKLSLICNNESTYDDLGNVVGGNITDRAILKFMSPLNVDAKVISSIPFDSKNKYAKTILENKTSLIKGAFEIIFPKCNYYIDKDNNKRFLINKKKTFEEVNKYVEKGIRVLTIAIEENNNYYLLGFILIKDEIRECAYNAIKEIETSGIKTVMITGDNKETAREIAKEVGLLKDNSYVLSSDEINNMSDEKLKSILPNLAVVSRALPSDKTRFVKLAQSLNLVVGMTGDGVNDAPALKKADVGISLGSATEVAKEASDIVILDDNIKSICNAILYGRTIFKSIRKFIIFQLSVNICAVLVSVIGPLLGINTPITVIQMLWINMIMDTLAGLAFSYEPPLKEYMKEPPKKKDEKIMNTYMVNEIIISSIYSAVLCLLFLKLPVFKNFFRPSVDNKYLMTAFFGLFIFIGIFNSFNARTNRLNLLSHILENKVFLITFLFIIIIQMILIYYGGDLFRTSGLTLKELEIMLLLAFSIIPIDFIRKIILRLKGRYDGV